MLQLSEDDCVGDSYLFEDHIELRIYGCKLPPFHLLVFMPMRIFVLEFMRQSLKSVQIHFFPAKKRFMFKLGNVIGQFIINSRHVFPVIEEILKKMEFQQGDVWHYDPKGVIALNIEKIKA